MAELIRKIFALDVKAYGFDAQTRRFKIVATDEAQDADGDVIDIAGWKFTRFAKNPVMPWCHDYRELPPAEAKGYSVVNKQLVIEAVLTTTEQADAIAKYLAAGHPLMASVGFDPIKSEPIYQQDGSMQIRTGTHYIEQELIEVSLCPIGSNPNALIQRAIMGEANEKLQKDMAELTKILEKLDLTNIPEKVADIPEVKAMQSKINELELHMLNLETQVKELIPIVKEPEKSGQGDKPEASPTETPPAPTVKVVEATPAMLAKMAEYELDRKIKLAKGGIIGGNL